jgi:hypothetical protein
VGALVGGRAVERTGSAALVYGVIGALVALLALGFSLGPLGHADRYLSASQRRAASPGTLPAGSADGFERRSPFNR